MREKVCPQASGSGLLWERTGRENGVVRPSSTAVVCPISEEKG
jgi:hypothetical protein